MTPGRIGAVLWRGACSPKIERTFGYEVGVAGEDFELAEQDSVLSGPFWPGHFRVLKASRVVEHLSRADELDRVAEPK